MNNILDVSNIKDICTGCRTCENVCPHKCILMQADEDGFLYPVVDTQICIDCGLCKKKCHVLHKEIGSNIDDVDGYCAWATDEIRMCSSSGGIFSLIVDSLPGDNWYIYGAAFDDDWMSVNHVKRKKDNYEDIRKSKYVFSDLNSIFHDVYDELQNGNNVLFSGTPCQIGALRRYLGKEYVHLLTIDIICHGISSTLFYQEHLNFIAKGREIVLVDFRPKGFGWDSRLRVNFNNGTVYIKDQNNDLYLYNYFHNTSLRKACYQCAYGDRHASDITLGDFWRIEKYNPKYRDEPGVSMILCNTEKGKHLVKTLSAKHLELIDSDYYKYVFNDGHSWYNINDRELFFSQLHTKGLDKLERKLYYRNLPYNIARKIKRLIIR